MNKSYFAHNYFHRKKLFSLGTVHKLRHAKFKIFDPRPFVTPLAQFCPSPLLAFALFRFFRDKIVVSLTPPPINLHVIFECSLLHRENDFYEKRAIWNVERGRISNCHSWFNWNREKDIKTPTATLSIKILSTWPSRHIQFSRIPFNKDFQYVKNNIFSSLTKMIHNTKKEKNHKMCTKFFF